MHRSKHKSYKKRTYKSNSKLNSEVHDAQPVQKPDGEMNFSPAALAPQNDLLNNPPQLNFIQAHMQAPTRHQMMSQMRLDNSDLAFNTNTFARIPEMRPQVRYDREIVPQALIPRNIQKGFEYASDNSEEENKGLGMRMDDKVYYSPFMIRTKENNHHIKPNFLQETQDLAGRVMRPPMMQGQPQFRDLLENQNSKPGLGPQNKY